MSSPSKLASSIFTILGWWRWVRISISVKKNSRFSFLLSIPAVLGSGILELKKAIPIVSGEDFSSLMIATIISGISGYAAIAFLLNYLRSKSIGIFIYYRLALGCLLLFLAVSGILS